MLILNTILLPNSLLIYAYLPLNFIQSTINPIPYTQLPISLPIYTTNTLTQAKSFNYHQITSMNLNKLNQTLQYAYSQSFRKIYQQSRAQQTSPNSPHQSPNKIFIQYQKAPLKSKNSNKRLVGQQNTTHNKTSQTVCIDMVYQNPVKRLHASAKKYSFSVFVRKTKKNQQESKNKTNSIEGQNKLHIQENKIKGNRQINSVIRTMYDNFKKFQTMCKRSQTSKSSRTSQPKQTPQSQQQTRRTATQYSKMFTINPTSTYRQNTSSSEQNKSSRTRINFMKTLSFGQKLQHSRELYEFRANEFSKGFLSIGKSQIPFFGYQDTQYDPSSFLKIEKCSLQKKDQNFIKQSMDFRDTLLKDRLDKDNKKKTAELMNALTKGVNGFSKYAETVRQNQYVAQMRGVKKGKKRWGKQKEEESLRNKISPW